MLDIDRTLSLGGGDQLPHRAQRLAGDRRPRTQIIGIPDPAPGFLPADPVPDMQHLNPIFRPDVFGRGLGLRGRQDLVIDRLSGAFHRFAQGLQIQQIPDVQAGVIQIVDRRDGILQDRVSGEDGGTVSDHIRTLVRPTDNSP
ncbi:hypothetical protein MAUB1S_00732 [Mycolicibacterium aubagnense]